MAPLTELLLTQQILGLVLFYKSFLNLEKILKGNYTFFVLF